MRLIRLSVVLLVLGIGVQLQPAFAQEPPRPSADVSRWFGGVGNKAAEEKSPAPGTSKDKPPHYLRQTTCSIPFTVDPSRTAPVELQLFVSLDRGQHWAYSAKAAPGNGTFAFRAVQDGEYWFALRTIEKSKQPVDPKALTPGLKIVFDTQQPQLDFDLSCNQNEIQATWKATDPNLAPGTLKIEYQTGSQEAWRTVRIDPPKDLTTTEFAGTHTWRLDEQSDSMVVRAEVQDLAGNNQVVTRHSSLTANVDRTASTHTPVAVSTKSYESTPARDGSVTWPSNNILPAPKKPPVITRNELPAPTTADSATEMNSLRKSRLASGAEGTSSAGNSVSTSPANSALNGLRPQSRPMDPVPEETAVPVGISSSQSVPTEGSEPTADLIEPPTNDSVLQNAPTGEHPRTTSFRRFNLDYEIDALGTATVEKVELWGTINGGRTWTRWLDDQDTESPVEVEVPSDGIYGFRVVIIASNQLASPPPEAGEPADIWVHVDSVKPRVELISAIYGEGEHVGQFDIRWQATDDGFGDRPITLTFSDKLEGPWNTIAAGLPNSGQYYWAVEPRIPRQIYLRIHAHDEAGNVGEHQINEPISTTGLIPQARIRGLRVSPPSDRSAGRHRDKR